MGFTSLKFIIFLAIIATLYYIGPIQYQKYLLLSASLCFYYTFGYKAFILILVSTLIAFLGARVIESATVNRYRKVTLILFVALEIGLLVSLKYLGFIRERLSLVVPVGISFYTLSIVGYLIDVYRSKYAAEKSIIHFMLHVMYFPHILQGPIARYDSLSKQFGESIKPNYQAMTFGMQLMIWGYIKKLVVADRVGIFVDAVYSNVYIQEGTILFIASIMYTIQLYMDFSGCVDIARGISEIFGIHLTQNFRQPYLSSSINDFWRRWHISLSSWFRDYVYIPLGGNRKGSTRRWINLLVVFSISGLWHGVGTNFAIWGLIHGSYQMIGAALRPIREKVYHFFAFRKERKAFHYMQVGATFFLVNEAWIFFRVADLGQALYVFRESIFRITPWTITDGSLLQFGISAQQWRIALVFIVVSMIVDVLHEKGVDIREAISEQHIIVRWGIYLAALFSILLWGVYGIGYDAQSFIYMNF